LPSSQTKQASIGNLRIKNSHHAGTSQQNSLGMAKRPGPGLPTSTWSGQPVKRSTAVKPPAVQRGGFYPQAPQRKPGRYRDDDDFESEDESDEGFVVDDDDEVDGGSEDWRKEMRQLTRYDPRK
jgi:hypothetical protein